jgi:hypothetical protein
LNQANAIFNQCYFIDVNGIGAWGGGRSLIIDPDGRVLQQAGEHETILTELLDLDHVHRTRDYGTLGLCQTWKQFREYKEGFPIYRDHSSSGEIYRNLSDIRHPSGKSFEHDRK